MNENSYSLGIDIGGTNTVFGLVSNNGLVVKKKSINLNNIIIDSKSGYSGAGRGVHKKFKNKNLYESLSAYGVGFHRHNSEIDQELKNNSSSKINFTFTPHIIPMFRGIFSTIYLDLKPGTTLNKVQNILKMT